MTEEERLVAAWSRVPDAELVRLISQPHGADAMMSTLRIRRQVAAIRGLTIPTKST